MADDRWVKLANPVPARLPLRLWGRSNSASVPVVPLNATNPELADLLNGPVNPGTTARERAVYQLRPPSTTVAGSTRVIARLGEDLVSVWWKGHHVGNFDREGSAEYGPVITALWNRDFAPEVDGQVDMSAYMVADYPGSYEDGPVSRLELHTNFYIHLAQAHLLVPVNLPPEAPHVLLPTESSGLNVQASSDYQDNRAPYLRPERSSLLFVTLHCLMSKTNMVEVRADGRPIGELTTMAAKEARPAIAEAEGHGLLTASRAVITGNHLVSAVKIHCRKIATLPPSWIAECTGGGVLGGGGYGHTAAGPSTRIPVLEQPTGWKFNSPPQWPVPPVGWQPHRGWEPDPSWEQPPPLWQYWVPTWDLAGCTWEDPRPHSCPMP